jgi:probable H4MPT-linked C1 transfer pathway protein
MTWLGLDIGGANLKAADGRGWVTCVPFELWRTPYRLQAALSALVSAAPAAERVAMTMTGELCDCFRTKKEGVCHILAATAAAADGKELQVYLVDGRFVTMVQARGATHLVAASNWHALARFACRFLSGQAGVLIDIGSTTSDIIPLVDGVPRASGRTDTERLISSELIYTGVGRTPVCAVAPGLPWRGSTCPVAAELFATTADAYLLLDQLCEQEGVMSAADGRPMTKRFARERLARMICADAATFNESDARVAAAAIRDMQLKQLHRALHRVLTSMQRRLDACVVSGSGEFLARLVADEVCSRGAIVSLSELLGPEVSQAAPAHALAVLAAEAAV